MTIPLTGDEGLFRRLGRVGYVALATARQQLATAAGLGGLVDRYQATNHVLVAALELTEDPLVRAIPTGVMGVVAPVASATLLAMTRADRPAAARSVSAALAELIRQMRAAGESVPACAVVATATALTDPANTGDGVLVLETRRGDGLVQENATAEAGQLYCTADSYSGAAAAGAESFAYAGAANTAGVWDYDYPNGSGSSAGLTAASPASGPLSNQDFEAWSGSPLAADDWSVSAGTWATHAYRYAASFADGTYCLALAAGATLPAVSQSFGTGGLEPAASYAVAVRLRAKSGAAAGAVSVELTDADYATTADDQAVANRLTVDAATLSATEWTTETVVFRTPTLNATGSYRLQVRVSTALTGSDVLVDDVVVVRLTALSTGGPGAAVIAGATPFAAGDGWSVVTSNDRAGAEAGLTWQSLFDRLFGMRGLGLLLPSSDAPTVTDDLLSDNEAPRLDFSNPVGPGVDSVMWIAPNPGPLRF